METRNRCYSYFTIVGEFDPDAITERLGIVPFNSFRPGDRRGDGSLHTFSRWSCGRCDTYEVDTAIQMRKTIAGLLDKVDVLEQIRKDFDVSFYLEVVPMLYGGDTAPGLSPSLDVIDFCHATRTEIDIDLYVYDRPVRLRAGSRIRTYPSALRSCKRNCPGTQGDFSAMPQVRSHSMKLAPAPFAMIATGQKTIELRLFDEKRQKIRPGERIIFTNTETGETLCATVTALHRFESFAALYQSLPLLRCGYTEADIAQASPADMEQYYSPEEQRRYGVVGIELRLCSGADSTAM